MATPTNFQPLPSAQACHNGVVAMGAPVAQMAMSLKTLNQVKFRSAAYYHIGHSTYQSSTGLTGYAKADFDSGASKPGKGETEEFDFFYFSLPTSQWVGIEVIYGASSTNPSALNGPNILLELYEISGGAIGTKIDEGCIFTYPAQIQVLQSGFLTGIYKVNTGSRLYTFPSGGLSAPTPPRPLYIPSANRGDELAIKVTAEEVKLFAVHLFDIYQEA